MNPERFSLQLVATLSHSVTVCATAAPPFYFWQYSSPSRGASRRSSDVADDDVADDDDADEHDDHDEQNSNSAKSAVGLWVQRVQQISCAFRSRRTYNPHNPFSFFLFHGSLLRPFYSRYAPPDTIARRERRGLSKTPHNLSAGSLFHGPNVDLFAAIVSLISFLFKNNFGVIRGLF